MQKGIVYWITGLAGAGKSTIGSALYYELRKEQNNIVILDGDILKQLTGGGYSESERRARAEKYSILCKTLADQGITVIICTIAMFQSVRDWNRKHIEKYIEVFLDVPVEVLSQRDKKGLYSRQRNGVLKDVAGLDVKAELPENPSITLKNDGSLSVPECVDRIKNYIPKQTDSAYRDTDYWNQYYCHHPVAMNNEESAFARMALQYMEVGKSLIEFGCGNGRDSLFFASSGIHVTGIDVSSNAINMLNKVINGSPDMKSTKFLCEDFSGECVLFQIQHDYCYSRFTLHAITEEQQQRVLKNAWSTLVTGGIFFIEVRSIHDDIYGKGKCVGRHAYIFDSHFRRFIDKEELIFELKQLGFEILYEAEGRGFAPYKDQDPVLIRIVAKKMSD